MQTKTLIEIIGIIIVVFVTFSIIKQILFILIEIILLIVIVWFINKKTKFAESKKILRKIKEKKTGN